MMIYMLNDLKMPLFVSNKDEEYFYSIDSMFNTQKEYLQNTSFKEMVESINSG